MKTQRKRDLARSALAVATATAVLMTGAVPANAESQIYGGGDCWAYLYSYTGHVTVQSLNDSCTTLGARHKYTNSSGTAYTNWKYSDNYWVNSYEAPTVTIPYGRAYD